MKTKSKLIALQAPSAPREDKRPRSPEQAGDDAFRTRPLGLRVSHRKGFIGRGGGLNAALRPE